MVITLWPLFDYHEKPISLFSPQIILIHTTRKISTLNISLKKKVKGCRWFVWKRMPMNWEPLRITDHSVTNRFWKKKKINCIVLLHLLAVSSKSASQLALTQAEICWNSTGKFDKNVPPMSPKCEWSQASVQGVLKFS